MPRLYKVSETAKILKTNRNTVYELIHSGKLKAYQIGCLKVSEEDLLEFISSRTLQTDTLGKEQK